ncbi:MAG: nuclear transport factor 2 family protein [Alphaproteobacteria bacterium]|nr:nuclear transport factor 2 family protein [Alphaproteobacteria bacterium]
MRTPEQDRETLAKLNYHYVRSVDQADTAWFEENLAADFFNTNPDGMLIGRAAFIAQIGRGSTVRNIREHDVLIRLFGDFAIIHARTTYQKPDGSEGAGRYTDDWMFSDGRWRCISAHVARL